MKQEPAGHQQRAERPQLQAAKLLYTFKREPGQHGKEASPADANTPRSAPKTRGRPPHQRLQAGVPGHAAHDGQKGDAAQRPQRAERTPPRHTLRPHTGARLSHGKEQPAHTQRNTGESWTRDAASKKPDTRDHVLCAPGPVKRPQRATAARLCDHTEHRWAGRLEWADCAVWGCAIEALCL